MTVFGNSFRTPRAARGARLVVAGAAFFALFTVLAAPASATALNFTLNSTSSTLDLTATGSLAGTDLKISEQNDTAKATRFFSPSAGSIKAELSPGSIEFFGGSVAKADDQRTGIFNTKVNLSPGVPGSYSTNAPGNYGLKIEYPLATPIVLPSFPVGSLGTVSLGKITGIQGNIALRDIELDLVGPHTWRTGSGKSEFNAQDVDLEFITGRADMLIGGVLDVAGITGLGSIADSLARVAVQTALTSLLPANLGFEVTTSLDPALFSTKMTIGVALSTEFGGLGTIPNMATDPGKISKVGSNWSLEVPVAFNLADLIDDALGDILDLDLNLALNGKFVATTPYVAVVPEPSTFVLAGVGLAGLGWYGARRRRS